MRIEKETPPNFVSRASVSPTRRFAIERSIDVDGDGDTADARARVAVSFDRHARERRPRTSATRDVQKKTLSSLRDDDDVAIRVRDGTGVLLNFSNKQTPRV